MKQLLFSLLALVSISALAQQDKSKRPSPPALVTQKIKNGTTITIDYSQPSLKGRAIGTEIAPYGEVWRTGANEATVFEIDRDVKIEGQDLPAGKYSLYRIPGEKEWVFIFNKTWKQWGTVYKQEEDALRVKVKPGRSKTSTEKMTFEISDKGKVSLLWGELDVKFEVE
jgi:hypothetical protein